MKGGTGIQGSDQLSSFCCVTMSLQTCTEQEKSPDTSSFSPPNMSAWQADALKFIHTDMSE